MMLAVTCGEQSAAGEQNQAARGKRIAFRRRSLLVSCIFADSLLVFREMDVERNASTQAASSSDTTAPAATVDAIRASYMVASAEEPLDHVQKQTLSVAPWQSATCAI